MTVTVEDLGGSPTIRKADMTDGQGRPVCGAAKRSGGVCMATAGSGTDHPGFGCCKYHGGSTPAGEKRAAKELVAARVTQMVESGEIEYTSPEEALMMDVTRAALAVAQWDREVDKLDDPASPRAQTIVNQWNEQRRLLHQASKIVIQSGIAKRHVEVAEMQAVVLMQALLQVIGSPEMALTPQQQASARAMLAAKLRQLSGGTVLEIS